MSLSEGLSASSFAGAVFDVAGGVREAGEVAVAVGGVGQVPAGVAFVGVSFWSEWLSAVCAWVCGVGCCSASLCFALVGFAVAALCGGGEGCVAVPGHGTTPLAGLLLAGTSENPARWGGQEVFGQASSAISEDATRSVTRSSTL